MFFKVIITPTWSQDHIFGMDTEPFSPTGDGRAPLTLMNSDPHVDFIFLTVSPPFSLSQQNLIRLQRAHGEEIVRSIYLDRSVRLDQWNFVAVLTITSARNHLYCW